MFKRAKKDFIRSSKQPAKVLKKRARISFPLRDPVRDERIVINVRGYRFETYRATLENYPDTFLGSAEKRNQFYDYDNQEVCLNRDHEIFQCVLFFYQSRGILAKPEWTPEDVFEEELGFYLLKDRFSFQSTKVLHTVSHGFSFKHKYWQKALWLLLEDPHSSLAATIIAHVCLAVIALSIFTYCMETLPTFHDNENPTNKRKNQLVFFILETTFVTWFTIEYILRVIASPNRRKFLTSPMGVVDFFVIVPYFITIALNWPAASSAVSLSFLRAIRLVRVLRILKLSRYSKGMKVLGKTLRESFGQLQSLFLCLLMAVVLSSSSLYYFEGFQNPNSSFISIPESFWFTIITMTTVGYGDVVPETIFGRISTAICLISGIVILLCLPTPVFIMQFGRFYRLCNQKNEVDAYQEPKTEISIMADMSNSGSVDVLPALMRHSSSSTQRSLFLSESSPRDHPDSHPSLTASFASEVNLFKGL